MLLLPSAPAQAQEFEHDPCAHAVTQAEINICWAEEVAQAEDALRRTFATWLEGAPRDQVGKLREAQERWLEYREAHLRAVYPAARPYEAYGSVYPMCVAVLRLRLTLERAAEIDRFLHPIGDDLCRSSPSARGSKDAGAATR